MAEKNTGDIGEIMGICPECQTGVLRLRYMTYFTWLGEELITVHNFPAWVCDVCGKRDYDPRAVKWLNTLLNPETGRTAPRPRGPYPGVDRIQP
jgi:YgiT-type zinc finger domain-containing protein